MASEFKDQLALLQELQAIDLDLHSLKIKLDALPSRIADKRQEYESISERIGALKTELEETEKNRRADEQELESSTEHYREREAKLYAIKTNKEYQAALKEISEGKRANREREDRIIQAMERIESLKKETEQLQGEFAEKEAAYKSAREEIEKEEAEFRQRMEAETARKPEIEQKLDKDVARKYGVIRGRYADALVGVIQGVCQGCSRRVPPQLFNELLRKHSLKTCPNCQRLLYVAEAPAAEDAAEE
jgi:predicted  nucleic acid-binding Zn-ribbon protein